MNNKFFNIAACPVCLEKNRTLHGLREQKDRIGCDQKHVFPIFDGIPRLRPCDEASGGDAEELEKYEERDFVDMYTWRQYGSLVQPSQDIPGTEAPYVGKILRVQSGGDVFYRTLVSLASLSIKSVNEELVMIDVGCGTGIVTGMMAERHPNSFCVGLDYSPTMVERANEVIIRPGDPFTFSIRDSKTRYFEARMRRWSLSNVGFITADATRLPFLSRCADMAIASNLLHRVKSPRQALTEIERVVKPAGFLLMSNSYDWKENYTSRESWFDNVCEIMDKATWQKELELDGVPFMVATYNRKYDLALNHVTLFKKK